MAKMSLVKVTLSTKKIVHLRKMKISDSETAAQMASPKANKDPIVLQIMMQKCLLQLLLVNIDDKPVTGVEREDLDSLFDRGEYSQLLTVIGKLSGNEEMGKEPTLELVSQ